MLNKMKSVLGGKKILIGISAFMIVAIGTFLTSTAVAAPSNELSLPEIETITFVDYWIPSHAGPGPHPTECSGSYKFTRGGLKWNSPSETYKIGSVPSGLNVTTAISDAFAAWSTEDSNAPTFTENNNSANNVGWLPLGSGGPVAYASISFYPATKEIISFTMVFNEDLNWSTDGSSSGFDVQNVATHEAGHVFGLGHVNAPKDGLETMYKYTTEGEIIKQTLCDGDINGIQMLY